MMKKIFSLSIAFSVLIGLIAVVYAENLQIPINCLCKERKYLVYGEKEIYQAQGEENRCYVIVDFDGPDEKAIREEVQKEMVEKTVKKLEQEQEEVDKAREAARQAKRPFVPLYEEVASDVAGFFTEGAENVATVATKATADIAKSLFSIFEAIYTQLPSKKQLPTLLRGLFQSQIIAYHQFLDEEIFGKAIAKISSFKKAEDLEKFLLDLEKKKTCAQENPKPNCIAEKAMCNYQKFVSVIYEQSAISLKKSDDPEEDVQVLLKMLQKRDLSLLQEARDAEEALDTSMAVYSQFYNSYFLHLKFKELIESLKKVRDLTEAFKTLIQCVPNKFVGIATKKCE